MILVCLTGLMQAARSFSAEMSSGGVELAFGYLLLAAYFSGRIVNRLGLPKLTGYLLCGVITGPFYSLLLPSMLVVCLSMIITHRWTIYSEQVRTRADSLAHRGELLHDVLAELEVGAVVETLRPFVTVTPSTRLRDVVVLIDSHEQRVIPVVDQAGLHGIITAEAAHAVLANDPPRGAVIAQDLILQQVPRLRCSDTIDHALELLALQHVDALPVVSDEGALVGLLDRRAILGAYKRRLEEARAT